MAYLELVDDAARLQDPKLADIAAEEVEAGRGRRCRSAEAARARRAEAAEAEAAVATPTSSPKRPPRPTPPKPAGEAAEEDASREAEAEPTRRSPPSDARKA